MVTLQVSSTNQDNSIRMLCFFRCWKPREADEMPLKKLHPEMSSTQAWEDGSVGKVLTVEVWGSKFESSVSTLKLDVLLYEAAC